ncbi:hypothetical protein [Falsirhodobacter halotolerans]|uniref:hypothetical protein n=1 Tax=Falsirhodobacter halotolerans TaxID=1146892 RepID=UPI001FD14EBF|nr:hypothetical protein [Falsirhodobacter halotolerans]MCJ8138626.1 hypothetical protein [Falsirhodobacter halotolerans]
MTQNTNTVVMQRRVEPHHSLDDYPIPPWATRALCEWLFAEELAEETDDVREPAANRGLPQALRPDRAQRLYRGLRSAISA